MTNAIFKGDTYQRRDHITPTKATQYVPKVINPTIANDFNIDICIWLTHQRMLVLVIQILKIPHHRDTLIKALESLDK